MKLKLKENNIQKMVFGNVFLEKNIPNILFFDYDGKLLYSYSNNEFLSLSSLPSLPDRTSENLTCDGWNWTLQHIKDQINNVGGVVVVGAVYHTTDDKTHITCKPTETFPQAYINLSPTVASAVTVDWGDGTTDTWTSTSESSLTKSHTYTGVTGSSVYDIAISCSSETYSFVTYVTGTEANNQTCVYTDIKLSNKVTSLGNNCFYNCYNLQSIVLPNSITQFGEQWSIANCYNLEFVSIPNSISSLPRFFLQNCFNLQFVSIPDTVTTIGSVVFSACTNLKYITIPNGTTQIGSMDGCHSLQFLNIPINTTFEQTTNFYQDNTSLQFVNIPNGVESLTNSFFSGCYSLQTITIPSSVTSMGNTCFNACYSLRSIYLKPTTPPTLSSTNSIPSNTNLVIYVPRGSLTAYQNATNWSSFSSKMVEYDY